MSASSKRKIMSKAQRNALRDKQARKFLEAYLKNPAPVGAEMRGQEIWVDYVSRFLDNKNGDRIITTQYGSVAAVIPGTKNDFSVAIEAHADEISWRVLNIHDAVQPNHKEGTLGVAANGGADPLVAVGSRVNILTKKGIVKGVFGLAATHVRDEDETPPKVHELFIDIGANSQKEVSERGVEIGDLVLFQDNMMEMGKKNEYIVSRALDDKICGYINTQVLRRIKESGIKLPYTLYVVNTVQEETSMRGARLMAERLKPNVAICLDVGHDTQTHGYNKYLQGDFHLGKGPMISFSTAMHPKTRDLIISTAKKLKIPLQRDASEDGSFAGTNTDTFADFGAAAALVSVPLRYMHTTSETVHKKDIRLTEKLVVETLKSITGDARQFDLYAHKRATWNKKF